MIVGGKSEINWQSANQGITFCIILTRDFKSDNLKGLGGNSCYCLNNDNNYDRQIGIP